MTDWCKFSPTDDQLARAAEQDFFDRAETRVFHPADLARTSTPVGQPCDVGPSVPLPVCVGISRHWA
jgi:hypothetical protein